MSDWSWRYDGPVLGLLALAAGVFFGDATLLRGAFFVQDVMVQNYPFRDFFAQALKAGDWPLWNPAINCGFPLFAEGQAGLFYPFNLLCYWLLPTYAGISLNIVFHIWWAGAGTYFFLRLLGCLRPAALVGAVTYAFGGYLIVRAMSPNFIDGAAWMPALFALLHLAVRRGGGWPALAAAVAGLQYLAGHPQAAVYAQGAAVLYGLFACWQGRARWSVVLGIVAVPLLGAALAGVQLWPTAELVRHSVRGSGVGLEQFLNMSLPPERLVTFLLPNFFGSSATGSYWGGRDGFYIQLCAFVGVVPLLLAAVAVKRRREATAVFFMGLAAVALVLSLGRFTPFYAWLYEVPGLHFFRIPTRFLLWLALALAVLAGLGLDALIRRPSKGLGPWLSGALLAGFARGFAWINRAVLLGDGAAADPSLGQYRVDLAADLIRCWAVLLVGAFLWHGLNRRRWARTAAWGLPLVVFAELYHFGSDFNGVLPPEVYLKTPPEARAILNDAADRPSPAPPRILSVINEENAPFDWHGGWQRDQTSYRAYPHTLRMYTGGLYGLANALPGWSPLHLGRHWQFMRGYPAIAPLAGIEYLVSHAPLRRRDMTALYAGKARVYRIEQTLPRAYVAPRAIAPGTLSQRLAQLRQGAVLQGEAVVLDRPRAAAEQAAPARRGQARIAVYRPEEVQIDLVDHNGGYLVLSDTHYPGWEAEVDGRPANILAANHVFRAVPVPKGARRVAFFYRPQSLWWGLGLTALAGALLALWGWKAPRLACGGYGLGDETPGLKAAVFQGLAVALLYAMVVGGAVWSQFIERCRVVAGWGG